MTTDQCILEDGERSRTIHSITDKTMYQTLTVHNQRYDAKQTYKSRIVAKGEGPSRSWVRLYD